MSPQKENAAKNVSNTMFKNGVVGNALQAKYDQLSKEKLATKISEQNDILFTNNTLLSNISKTTGVIGRNIALIANFMMKQAVAARRLKMLRDRQLSRERAAQEEQRFEQQSQESISASYENEKQRRQPAAKQSYAMTALKVGAGIMGAIASVAVAVEKDTVEAVQQIKDTISSYYSKAVDYLSFYSQRFQETIEEEIADQNARDQEAEKDDMEIEQDDNSEEIQAQQVEQELEQETEEIEQLVNQEDDELDQSLQPDSFVSQLENIVNEDIPNLDEEDGIIDVQDGLITTPLNIGDVSQFRSPTSSTSSVNEPNNVQTTTSVNLTKPSVTSLTQLKPTVNDTIYDTKLSDIEQDFLNAPENTSVKTLVDSLDNEIQQGQQSIQEKEEKLQTPEISSNPFLRQSLLDSLVQDKQNLSDAMSERSQIMQAIRSNFNLSSEPSSSIQPVLQTPLTTGLDTNQIIPDFDLLQKGIQIGNESINIDRLRSEGIGQTITNILTTTNKPIAPQAQPSAMPSPIADRGSLDISTTFIAEQ